MSESNNVEVSTENTIDWEARAKKAEAKIVDMKTNQPETKTEEVKTEPVTNNNFMTREDYQKEEFFKNNPELSEHKDIINEKVSKGYSLEDAKTVLLSQDETIQARKITQNTNFTAWSPDFSRTEYNISDLENMPQAQYEQVMKAQEEWKVVIK